MELLNKVAAATEFLNESNSYEVIESNLLALKAVEKDLKVEIARLLKDPIYEPAITPGIKTNFDAYLLKNWPYFTRPDYDNDALKILFAILNDFPSVMANTYLNQKRTLLNYQVELEKGKQD